MSNVLWAQRSDSPCLDNLYKLAPRLTFKKKILIVVKKPQNFLFFLNFKLKKI